MTDTARAHLIDACYLAEAYEHYRSAPSRARKGPSWALNDVFLLTNYQPLARWSLAHSTASMPLLDAPASMCQALTGTAPAPGILEQFTTSRRGKEAAIVLLSLIGPRLMGELPLPLRKVLADTFMASPRWGDHANLSLPKTRALRLHRLVPITQDLSEDTVSLAERLVARVGKMTSENLRAEAVALASPVQKSWERLTDAPW